MSRATSSTAQYFIRVFSIAILLLSAHVTSAQNTISTVAGSAPANNVAPTAAPIEGPQAIARDAAGNLYVVNDIGVIYKVTAAPPSSMSIYAGNNTAGFSPNGTLANASLTFQPTGAALDANGNLYFSDQNNCVVREIVAATGIINTVAGTPGACNYAGDGGAATSAHISFPQGVALDGWVIFISRTSATASCAASSCPPESSPHMRAFRALRIPHQQRARHLQRRWCSGGGRRRFQRKSFYR